MRRDIVELYTLGVDGNTVYVGSDILTHERLYYVIKDNKMIPASQDIIDKINIEESKEDYQDIKRLVESKVSQYIRDNEQRKYPNKLLNINWDNICIDYNKNGLYASSASYDVFNNTLNYSLPYEYSRGFLTPQMRAVIDQVITHEIGHMAASELEIERKTELRMINEMETNIVHITNLVGKTGFLEMRIPIIDEIVLDNGDSYYRVDKNREVVENGGRGLEELFNEMETDERTNNATAPYFGRRLDILTDGKLRLARFNHSLDTFYSMMEEIYSTIGTARFLLAGIDGYYKAKRTGNEEIKKEFEEVINKLLDYYEVALANLGKN